MSFLKNSLNYSIQTYLQQEFLIKHLKTYNNFITNKIKNAQVCPQTDSFFIPNNNNKFYLFIIPKHLLEKNKNNSFSIFYFFSPDNPNENFYIESHYFADSSYLFEGYLYNNNDKREYLVTDYLMNNNLVLSLDFVTRRELILKEFSNKFNYVINDNITINIHQVLNNKNLIDIFKKNFIYNNSLNCIEIIENNFHKKRYLEIFDQTPKEMLIEKGDATEIYNVLNPLTNDYNGVLYIKTLQDSRKMRESFTNRDKLLLKCIFNTTFNKWSPVLK